MTLKCPRWSKRPLEELKLLWSAAEGTDINPQTRRQQHHGSTSAQKLQVSAPAENPTDKRKVDTPATPLKVHHTCMQRRTQEPPLEW